MARPRKEGMDYFPHDVHAANDKKVEALRMLYGNDGYAFFFILLENIYQEPNFELDISDAETIQILCRKTEVTPEKFNSMLETALKRDCFDRESYEQRGVLTSSGIKKRAEVVVKKRVKMQEAYKKEISDIVSEAEMGVESTQSKVKESKVKESNRDIKDIGTKVPKRFIPPTMEQVIEYCLERQNNVDPEKWMNHYTSNGWKVGKNGMKDWKAAVRTWEKNSGGFGITTFKTKSSEFQDQIDMMKNRIGGTAYEEASATGSRTDITPHQDGISEFYLNTGRSRHMDNDADWSRYGNGDGEF